MQYKKNFGNFLSIFANWNRYFRFTRNSIINKFSLNLFANVQKCLFLTSAWSEKSLTIVNFYFDYRYKNFFFFYLPVSPLSFFNLPLTSQIAVKTTVHSLLVLICRWVILYNLLLKRTITAFLFKLLNYYGSKILRPAT